MLDSRPWGNARCTSGIASRTAEITVSGLASGVAVMPMNTAFTPSNAAAKLLFSGPSSSLAIWPSRMIVSPRVATTSCSNSSGLSSEVCALMFFWVNSAFTSPAAVVKLLAAKAFRTSSGVMPSEAILSGSSHARMAKVEPPRISADATPLIACRRGRTTRSR